VTVYIEVVVLNNLALDALLVVSTLFIRRKRLKWWRILLPSAIGAACAAAYPILPIWAQIVIRAALAPIMCAVMVKYGGVKDYLVTLLLFAGLTFALGGTVYGISNLTGIEITGYISLGISAASALAILVVVRAFMLRMGKISKKICTAKLVICGESITVKSMCDTGNTLTDSLTGLPVVIVSKELEQRLTAINNTKKTADTNMTKRKAESGFAGQAPLEKAESGFTGQVPLKNSGSGLAGMKIEGFIEVKTVSGNGSLPMVSLGEITVGKRKFNVLGGLSRQSFDGYDIILQNTMF
jgi:stage II sporulation protein GA (sporulation sigma-E factor processing peptidase)